MFKLGITGGIASGKSTATTYIEKKYGAYIFNADKESKKHWKKAEKSADEFKKALQAFAKSNGDDFDEIEKEFWDSVK